MGLHLYMDILNESVASARGESVDRPHSLLRLDPNIVYSIPDTYISNTRERLGVYYRLMACHAAEDVEDLQSELSDRYGKLPKVAQHLFQSAAQQLKNFAEQYGAIGV